MVHDDNEVQQWLARDPAHPHRRSPAEWARFRVMRRRLLRPLRRDPRLWLLQGGNILGGLARYALFLGGFLVLAPPVLVFWAGVCWPVGDPPPRLSLPVPEGGPPVEGIPGLWSLGGICLAWLVMLDILLGWRLSRFRNVFVARAERIAWAVVDEEFAVARGTRPRRPDTTAQDTTSAP